MIYADVDVRGGALKEREIESVFKMEIKGEDVKLKVSLLSIENMRSCRGCYFDSGNSCSDWASILGACSAFLRSDRRSIIFERIK